MNSKNEEEEEEEQVAPGDEVEIEQHKPTTEEINNNTLFAQQRQAPITGQNLRK